MALTELVTIGLVVVWWLSAIVGVASLVSLLSYQWRGTYFMFRDDMSWTFSVALIVWGFLSLILYNLPGGGA